MHIPQCYWDHKEMQLNNNDMYDNNTGYFIIPSTVQNTSDLIGHSS